MQPDRPARRIQPAGETSGIPERMIFFDTETYPMPVDEKRSVNRLKLGWVSYVDNRHGSVDRMEFTEPWEFWDQVERRIAPKQRLWCFSHFSDYDLAVLDWHTIMVERRGWKIGEKFIIGGPTCIDLRKGSCTVRLVDTMNWFNTSVRALGETLGFPKGDVDYDMIKGIKPGTPAWNELSSYCRRDVEILERAMASWIGLVRTRDLGPFAFTAAGQAFTAYRRRFLPDQPMIVPPSKRGVLALERASYAGGLTAVWYRGRINGPVRVADVTSMYPYVMKVERYPRALQATYRPGQVSVHKLSTIVEGGSCVVAQLYVDVPAGVEMVPVKGERLEYPSGRFTTTLTTPEVAEALKAGVVLEVGQVNVYHTEDIFRRWVDEMFQLRTDYLEAGNTVYADLVKIGLLNSLYGKFGQYNYEWDQVNPEALNCWGADQVVIDGVTRPLRWLGDYCEARSPIKLEPALSFPAIAAHVTAYARVLLRRYRAVCGVENVFYGDTDSLFLTPAGLERGRAAGIVLPYKTLGSLYHDEDRDAYIGGMIHGLKVYQLDRGDGTALVKMKGVRRGGRELEPGVFEVTQYRGLRGQLRERDGRSMTTQGRRELKAITDPAGKGRYRKGVVTGTGWVVPNQRAEPAPHWKAPLTG